MLAIDGAPLVQGGVPLPWLLRGPECSLAVVTVSSPGEPAREVAIVRHRYSVEQAIDVSGCSRLRMEGGSDTSSCPASSTNEFPGQVEAALLEYGPLDGLVIDNRVNGGGSSSVAEPILSLFTSGVVGEFLSQTGSRPLRITPRDVQGSQSVPLIVLIGEDTVSYGEVFAGVLQDQGRARLVGQTTAGNVETLHGYTYRRWVSIVDCRGAVCARRLAGRLGRHRRPSGYRGRWPPGTPSQVEDDPAVAAALELLGAK